MPKSTRQRLEEFQTDLLSYIEVNASLLRRVGATPDMRDIVRNVARLEIALAEERKNALPVSYFWEANDVHGNCVDGSGTAPTREAAEKAAQDFCALHPNNQMEVSISILHKVS